MPKLLYNYFFLVLPFKTLFKREENMKFKIENVIKGALASFIGASMALTANIAFADYPDKDITFIVPYSPGGGSDQMARRLQPGLEKALGVNVKIVYKTGGVELLASVNYTAQSQTDTPFQMWSYLTS